MKNVLIIYFSIANPEPLIERALELLAPNSGKLHLLFYLEDHIPKTLSSIMAYIGFLGEKVKSDMEKSIIDNYHVQVQDIIKDANIQAKKNGVELNHYSIANEENLSDFLKKNNLAFDYVIINHTENEYIYQAAKNNDLQILLHAYKGKCELYSDGLKSD